MSKSPPLHLAERAQFKALIVANPNHFGNLKVGAAKSALSVSGNTTYEQLGCVGYHSQLERLEGIITIKQGEGYSGGICSTGSLEYVRFYTSMDNGVTWVDQGVASTAVYDLGGTQHVEYAVALQIDPSEQLCFLGPKLPLVRAILQWSAPPPAGQPDYPPIWGNVVNTQIQIESLKRPVLGDLLKQAQFPKAVQPLIDALDVQQTVAVAPRALSAAALQGLYASAVPPQRFALADLHALSESPSLLTSSITVEQSLGITISPAAIVAALAPAKGDTAYEQLNCVGFNANVSLLEAVIRIKQPAGYSGGLCTAGSREYVAFWADPAGNGTFTSYLGTASVGVYDISALPAGGLDYAVLLPVDLSPFQKPCSQGPVLLPIRATLSWQVSPTPSNPGFVPTWGNTVQSLIQVHPGVVVGTTVTPVITAVGDAPVSSIDSNPSDPNFALATGTTIVTGMALTNSPFGGRIDISGKILNGTSATQYRLMGKPHGAPASAYAPITAEPGGLTLSVLNLATLTDDSITIHADVDGYYTYQDSANTVLDSVLMSWQSVGVADGLYDLYIDVKASPSDILSGTVTVAVDNTAPAVTLTVNTPAGMQCPDVLAGGTVTGTFSATDLHYRTIAWEILPALGSSANLPSVTGTLTPDGYPSATYSIATNGMPPCGYSLTLNVWDRTNVNSGQTNNYSSASIGFCIMPAGTVLP